MTSNRKEIAGTLCPGGFLYLAAGAGGAQPEAGVTLNRMEIVGALRPGGFLLLPTGGKHYEAHRLIMG